MDGFTLPNTGSALTEQSFHKMLSWLDRDIDSAGAIYEEIRTKLIKLFLYRGCTSCEELADETINRVVKKIDELADRYVGDPRLYFYGVARNVRRESLRKREEIAAPPDPGPQEDVEDQHVCLELCLQRLPDHEYGLILQYYQEDKRTKIDNRKVLAQQLDIPSNTLRKRTKRIREKLKDCIGKCLKRVDAV